MANIEGGSFGEDKSPDTYQVEYSRFSGEEEHPGINIDIDPDGSIGDGIRALRAETQAPIKTIPLDEDAPMSEPKATLKQWEEWKNEHQSDI